MNKLFVNYISRYNEVEGTRDLDQLNELQLVGYYCKNFEFCMSDKLLDDINRKAVPYVKGMHVKGLIDALQYGGKQDNDLFRH